MKTGEEVKVEMVELPFHIQDALLLAISHEYENNIEEVLCVVGIKNTRLTKNATGEK